MRRSTNTGWISAGILGLLVGLGTPDVAQADFEQGLILLQQKYYKEAAVEFEKETKSNKKLDKGWYYLGRSYAGSKQYAKAAEAFKVALELTPGTYDYAVGLGKSYLGAKNYEAASSTFSKAYGMAKDSKGKYECAYFQGQSLMSLKKYGDAADALSKAYKIKGSYKVAMSIANAEFKAEDYTSSAKAYQNAVKYKSSDKKALEGATFSYVKIASAKRAAGDKAGEKEAWKSVATWAGKGSANHPSDKQLAQLAANGLFRSEQLSKAIGAYGKAVKLEPDNCALRTELGLAHFKLKQFDSAKTELSKAVDCDGNSQSAHSYLGYTYNELAKPKYKQGDASENVDLLQASVDLRTSALKHLKKANTLKASTNLSKMISTVQANITTAEENIQTIKDNLDIDATNAKNAADYDARMKQAEDYNKKVEEFQSSQKEEE